MADYIVDGKPYGLSAEMIKTLLDAGISTFDQLVEASNEDRLEELFEVFDQLQVLLALHEQQAVADGESLMAKNGRTPFLHLLKDAKQFGLTDQMIEKFNSAEVYTILQAMDLAVDKWMTEIFPDEIERHLAIQSINLAGERLGESFSELMADLETTKKVKRAYQARPSVN